ncbi:hypothetical protein NW767_014855 [Fusarium falciforme]|nr:hypothetical protein NW767_014855 [Fusarium falciforme]
MTIIITTLILSITPSITAQFNNTPRASAPVKHNKPDHFTSGATEQNEPKSINKQRGKKDAKVNGAAPAASGSVGKPLAELGDTSEVDELVEHRVNRGNSTVKFKVKRKASGETAWKTERDLQEKVPALVYKYWDGLGRRDTATRLKLYHVFKILKRASPPEKSKDAQYTNKNTPSRDIFSTEARRCRPALRPA